MSARPLTIAGIVTSPHHSGMTARLLRRALDGAAAAGAATFTIHLAEQPLDSCRGCKATCWQTLRCVQDEDGTRWHERLQAVDGIVVAVPVYCWQMNGLAHLFIDRMRWDTGSVLRPRNPRAAFGIACAGGSGTGCVLALQALYRYFYNWAFHGIAGLPVTPYNYAQALDDAQAGGAELVRVLSAGLRPFAGLADALAHYETLPYLSYQPLDELRLIVHQLRQAMPEPDSVLLETLHAEAEAAEDTFEAERGLATEHLGRAYEAGYRAWKARASLS